MNRSNRRSDEIRNLQITPHIQNHADGSVLLELGNTKVLCAVSLQSGVPRFMQNKGIGWLTAEYSMLPAATRPRSDRESVRGKCSGRTVEISRLIGRSLRTCIDFTVLGENTIHIDCDVLQADGGTRTAAITGAYVALKLAAMKWQQSGIIKQPLMIEDCVAISVGIKDKLVLLDLDFVEDSSVDVDCNFVLTRSGDIIEIQGTAERRPISWEQFEQMRQAAMQGIEQLFHHIDLFLLIPNKTNAVQSVVL